MLSKEAQGPKGLGPQSGPEASPKWSQSGPKVAPKQPQSGPKQPGSVPEVSQKHTWSIPEAPPRRPRSRPKAAPKQPQSGPKVAPKHPQSSPKAAPKHLQSILKAAPKQPTLLKTDFIPDLILGDFWPYTAYLYDIRMPLMMTKLKMSEKLLKKMSFIFFWYLFNLDMDHKMISD